MNLASPALSLFQEIKNQSFLYFFIEIPPFIRMVSGSILVLFECVQNMTQFISVYVPILSLFLIGSFSVPVLTPCHEEFIMIHPSADCPTLFCVGPLSLNKGIFISLIKEVTALTPLLVISRSHLSIIPVKSSRFNLYLKKTLIKDK
jgi:hypothetical protein